MFKAEVKEIGRKYTVVVYDEKGRFRGFLYNSGWSDHDYRTFFFRRHAVEEARKFNHIQNIKVSLNIE
jgi:hypothetical protein